MHTTTATLVNSTVLVTRRAILSYFISFGPFPLLQAGGMREKKKINRIESDCLRRLGHTHFFFLVFILF